jgi:hypothetical protein
MINKYILINIIVIIILILITIRAYYAYSFTPIKEKVIIPYNPDSIISKINYDLYPNGFIIEQISKDPKIYYLHNFLTEKEANHMIELCEKHKEESTVTIADEHGVSFGINKKYRTSLTAYLKKGQTKKVIKIEKRAINLAQVDYEQLDPLQVLVYKSDDYVVPHLDTFLPNSKDVLERGNRFCTIFPYLSTLSSEEGGCTNFVKLNIKIQPKKCDAIYFENLIDGKIDDRLLHEGQMVTGANKKYAINIWIREKNIKT